MRETIGIGEIPTSLSGMFDPLERQESGGSEPTIRARAAQLIDHMIIFRLSTARLRQAEPPITVAL